MLTIAHLNSYVSEIKSQWEKYHSETQELLVNRIDPRIFLSLLPSQIQRELPGQVNLELAETFRLTWNFYGSDKSSRHAYEDFYSSLQWESFSNKTLLEVGIGSNDQTVKSNMGIEGHPGASLFAWSEIFHSWKIYGADIDPKAVAASMKSQHRIISGVLDQTDVNSWKRYLEEISVSQFSIIVDDGLHEAYANISTLFEGYDLLEVGGILVIEDVPLDQFTFWQFLFEKGCLPLRPNFWNDTNPLKVKSFDSGLVYFIKDL